MGLRKRPASETTEQVAAARPIRILSSSSPVVPADDTDPGGAANGGERRLRVALVTEGTYPNHGGGVSVWCDQLTAGLGDVDFRVVAITLNQREQLRWDLHANSDLAYLPLWDRVLEANEPAARPERLPALWDLASLLCSEPAASPVGEVAFLRIIDRLAAAAIEGRLAGGLQYGVMCEAFGDAVANSPWLQERRGATLLDVAKISEAFVHILRPLLFDIGSVDVVHTSAGGLCTLVALGAKARHGTPFMLTEHGLFLRERYIGIDREIGRTAVKAVLMRFYQLLASAAYRTASLIAPVSEYNQRWQLRMGAPPERVRVIHSAVEPSKFPIRLTEPSGPSISWLGRIDPIKDLHTLIRAAAVVHDQRPDVVVRIFGSATPAQEDYLSSCRNLVSSLDLDGVVRFEGHVDTAADAFHVAQISALTSISEGFPYSVLESMACGVPVVGTDVGGVSEAIGNTGRCVAAKDHEAIGAACLELLDSASLRHSMGIEARRRVEQRFGLDEMLEIHRETYTGLAALVDPLGAHRAALEAHSGPSESATEHESIDPRGGLSAVRS